MPSWVHTKSVERWTVSEVILWLVYNGLSDHIVPFFINRIDGLILSQINSSALQQDLNLSAEESGDLLAQLAVLQNKPSSPLSPPKGKTVSPPQGEDWEGLSFSWGEKVKIGCKIDCLDSLDKWYNAVVLSVSPQTAEILVHYLPLDSKWDEWVFIKSDRIAPFNSHAFHRKEEALAEALNEKNKFDRLSIRRETDEKTTCHSAYTPKYLRHEFSDAALFDFLKQCLKIFGRVDPSMLIEKGVGRLRAKHCHRDFFQKLVTGEPLEPPEVFVAKTKRSVSEASRDRKNKRARRTTAMLTDDWIEGNRKGLWRCPKCEVVLTAQKRYTHPCFRDNLLTIEQYNQSLIENQFRSDAINLF